MVMRRIFLLRSKNKDDFIYPYSSTWELPPLGFLKEALAMAQETFHQPPEGGSLPTLTPMDSSFNKTLRPISALMRKATCYCSKGPLPSLDFRKSKFIF